jgi:hypothetical protein
MNIKQRRWVFLLFILILNLSRADIPITQQMLKGKIFQTKEFNTTLIVKILPTSFKSFDGDILFHFITNDPEEDERLSYRLINGKMIFYGNDASKYRWTLLFADTTKWIIQEEEDIDGDDPQYDFKVSGKNIYYLVPSESIISPPIQKQNKSLDTLCMGIYRNFDTRMPSTKRKNNYLYTIIDIKTKTLPSLYLYKILKKEKYFI